MTQEYADSTVAISIYNVLATIGGPVAHIKLFHQVRTMQHPNLTKVQFDVAINRLGRLKLITNTELGFKSVDTKRRVIVSRDRSDMKEGAGGKVFGGWNGWVWKDPAGTVSKVFRERRR